MNIWWIVLGLLGCAWAVPMMGSKQAGMPWWFFICVGCFWCAVCVLAEPLYDWGIRIRRELGLVRLANWGERMKPNLLPPARLALLIMALISFAAGIL